MVIAAAILQARQKNVVIADSFHDIQGIEDFLWLEVYVTSGEKNDACFLFMAGGCNFVVFRSGDLDACQDSVGTVRVLSVTENPNSPTPWRHSHP